MNNSTSFNIMNKLNESDTNAFKLNKKVIIESDKVVTKNLKEDEASDTYKYTYSIEDLKNIMRNDDYAKNPEYYDGPDSTFNLDDYLNNSGIASIDTENKLELLSGHRGPDYYGIPTGKVRVNYKDGTSKVFNCIGDYEGVSLYNIIDGVVPSETNESDKQICEKCGKPIDECTCNKKELKEEISARSNYDKLENAIDEGIITKDQIADELMQALSDDDLAYYLSNIFDFGDDKDLEESEKKEATNKIEEAEVKNLQEVKSQGNIYMLKDDNKYMVGENYNESEGILENAEIYENKDEADKDYLSRCDIKKDNKEADLDENLKDTIDNAVYNTKMKHYQNKQKRLYSKSEKYHKKAYDLSNKAQDAYHKWSDMEDKEIAKEMKNKAAKENK